MSLYKKDSIVALATPRGIGAVAVIRISGESLSSLFLKLTKIKKIKPRHVYYKEIFSSSGEVLDNSLVVFFKGPSSFTGEDVIEISCHGGEAVSKKIIQQLIVYGCRYAGPGEFSKRAFMNGKIDLTKAEAINKIIHAKSYLEAKNSLMSLGGKVQRALGEVKKGLTDLLIILEHELDFVEEEVDVLSNKKIKDILGGAIFSLKKIIDGSLAGKKIEAGFRVVFVGPPNAGKSSLFNSILGYDKAIVSDIKGTTRDTVDAFVEINRYPVVLSDTAGHYKTKNSLDLKGVKKTEEAINKADIILAIDEKDPGSFIKSFNIKNKPIIKVVSKTDLLKKVPKKKGVVYVSSLENTNIDFLLTELSTLIRGSFFDGESFFVPERQLVLLQKAQQSLGSLFNDFDGLDMIEVAAILRGSVEFLQEVFGEIYNEDVLNDIFKGFCVGK